MLPGGPAHKGAHENKERFFYHDDLVGKVLSRGQENPDLANMVGESLRKQKFEYFTSWD